MCNPVKEGGGACTCDSTLGDRTLQTSCLRHHGNFVQGSGQQVAEGVGRDAGLHGDIPDQAPLLPQQDPEKVPPPWASRPGNTEASGGG